MSGVWYSEMQFAQGGLQGRYRAKRAVNETVSAPFPAAAAWGPLLLYCRYLLFDGALYMILYG